MATLKGDILDMFDFSWITEFIRLEPGHGLLQSVLLFMIWLQSRGLRKEMMGLKDGLAEAKFIIDKKFDIIEGRLSVL